MKIIWLKTPKKTLTRTKDVAKTNFKNKKNARQFLKSGGKLFVNRKKLYMYLN